MSMSHNPVFSLTAQDHNRLTLRSAEGHVAHVFVLENDIVRVMLLPRGELRFPRSWAIAPGAEDVAYEGRDRFDLEGFTLPDYQLEQDGDTLTISTAAIRLSIRLAGFFCHDEVFQNIHSHAVLMKGKILRLYY